tara:strand:- start:2648 stop:3178 length:531 start_codon:yes stop_codon:yes gene_type:complete
MKSPYQTYEQLGNRVPRYLADEFGIDSMSATAAEDYIRLAKLEPVPVPTKQQASYPGDRTTWYVDPKRTQAFKLLITAGTADKLLPKKNKQVPKYVNNKLKEAVDMLPPKVKLEEDERKEITQLTINSKISPNHAEIVEDITNIRDMLEQQTGMYISAPNVIRACIKAWYDLNNNG